MLDRPLAVSFGDLAVHAWLAMWPLVVRHEWFQIHVCDDVVLVLSLAVVCSVSG
jgi:hypothetical protein